MNEESKRFSVDELYKQLIWSLHVVVNCDNCKDELVQLIGKSVEICRDHKNSINARSGQQKVGTTFKQGDLIAIHTEEGCKIAKMISDEGDTITAECGSILGNHVLVYGIPKNICTLHVAVDR